MAKAKYLVFPNPTVGGMVNLLMELEVRVGLAMLANRTLVSANKFPVGPQPDDEDYQRQRSATMLDLFDLPVKHISLAKLERLGYETRLELPWRGECATQACFMYPSADIYDEKTQRQFKHQRLFQWQFPADKSADAWFASSIQRTFSHYSYFFLTPDNVRGKLRKTIAKIQPKSAYQVLAKKISASLGRYNAIHVRLGDFRDWWIKTPQAEDIVANISSYMASDKPLIICTDNSADSKFFDKIVSHYPQSLFIDDYMVQEFSEELAQLPFNDATVVALLTQLIAVEAEEFSGTLFSTFSGAIHRKRLLRDATRKMRFVFNPFDVDKVPMREGEFIPEREGMYSWNRFDYDLPIQARAYSWFREWPEAVENK